MVKPIVKNTFFLSRKSIDAKKEDVEIAIDLIDTLKGHEHECVGMAANMIGISKRIIIVNDVGKMIVMFNPCVMKKQGEYESEEGCLSLSGVRRVKRYQMIEVLYRDIEWKQQKKVFSGLTAQIIQHEIDHCNGKLV